MLSLDESQPWYYDDLLRVEKDSLLANKWNEVDGRKTNQRTAEPVKSTYAEDTKKRKLSWKRKQMSKSSSHFQELTPS